MATKLGMWQVWFKKKDKIPYYYVIKAQDIHVAHSIAEDMARNHEVLIGISPCVPAV